MIKTCSTCCKEKPVTEFYATTYVRRGKQWTGFRSKCKRCFNKMGAGITDRVKDSARNSLRKAVRRGTIQKPTACTQCGTPSKVEGHHHEGYDNARSVKWLCRKCHVAEHRRSG